MSAIRSRNTAPEMFLRRQLHQRGFRYRLNVRDLPGRPDIVLPRYSAVIFAHGCFWHGHDCHLFRWPGTRVDFWKSKITRNREVDRAALDALQARGWRTAVVWECALRGPSRLPADEVLEGIVEWLTRGEGQLEIRSTSTGVRPPHGRPET